jgi:hypothetical protein
MRIAALSTPGRRPEFSWEGTIFAGMTIFLLSFPFGLLFLLFRRFVRGSALRQGLLYGSLLLLMPGLPWLFTDVLKGEPITLGNPTVNRLLFGLLFVVYGLVVALITDWIERHPKIVEALLKTD